MNLELTNRPVLVCASSAGLGKATALEFAREGARVMLCGRHAAQLEQAAAEIAAATGHAPQWTVADLTDAQSIAQLMQATLSAFGALYTLVYNSGGPPAGGSTSSMMPPGSAPTSRACSAACGPSVQHCHICAPATVAAS